MGEYEYYTDEKLRIISIGNIISIVGIIFKVFMLESKDIEAGEDNKGESKNSSAVETGLMGRKSENCS